MTGRVVDGQSAQPIAGATVFASTPEETLSQRYRIAGLPPEFWMTPDYLARLSPWATPIRLGVGEKVTVALEARLVVFAR